jgi:hypothetical protein
MRDVAAAERLDDAPLAQDPLVAALRRGRRWDAERRMKGSATDLVDLVLRTACDQAVLEGLAASRQALAVHPTGEAGEIGGLHVRPINTFAIIVAFGKEPVIPDIM